MPVSSPPIHGPTVGIYHFVGNDEALMSNVYTPSLQTSLDEIYKSAFWRTKEQFAMLRCRLSALAHSLHGWDSLGSELPNAVACSLTARILGLLETVSLPPTRLTPAGDGGIALSFVEASSRAVIEIYNTGEIAAATYSDLDEPSVWEPDPTEFQLLGSIEQIRVHLAS